MNYRKRAMRLAERALQKERISCIVIMSIPNLRYFFNYSGESYERFCCGILSKDGSRSALVVPRLDLAKAEKSAAQATFSWTDHENYSGSLSDAMNELGVNGGAIGTELSISMGQMDNIKSVVGASNFVSVSEEISDLRLEKDENEIKSIKNSARILNRAYERIPEFLRPGKREIEVGQEIRNFLTEKGATCQFCAVQSGKNSAIPHSEVTYKTMERGDLIVIDVSSTNHEGYYADFTRTYSFGKPSEKQREIYAVVKSAQRNACLTSEIGALTKDVDNAARSIISNAGYSNYFFTRTGHGLGLEVHEPPWIKGDNEQELRRGMVFTVEPGIYIPGKFGARIEDNLIIEKERATNLTTLSHELVEI
jgi:Xaa-Pro aminopeptidase